MNHFRAIETLWTDMEATSETQLRRAEQLLRLGQAELAEGRSYAALTSAQLAIAYWPYDPIALAARSLTSEALAQANQRSQLISGPTSAKVG